LSLLCRYVLDNYFPKMANFRSHWRQTLRVKRAEKNIFHTKFWCQTNTFFFFFSNRNICTTLSLRNRSYALSKLWQQS
jgi:hypothetical protein